MEFILTTIYSYSKLAALRIANFFLVSFVAELAGDVAKMAQLKNLGTLLDEVYPDGSKAPDDFSHWVVEMQRPEVPVTVEPTVIISATKSKNPTSPNRSQADDRLTFHVKSLIQEITRVSDDRLLSIIYTC